MTRRRRTRNLEGGLLDCPPNISQESWLADSLLDKIQPAPLPPACHCPPAQANRLGGCRPMLRWAGHDQLQPFCLICGKALVAGVNRRRDQVRMIALAMMEPGHLDIPDLVYAGWLVGDRPAPPEPPRVCPLLRRSPRPRPRWSSPMRSRPGWGRCTDAAPPPPSAGDRAPVLQAGRAGGGAPAA